ncbi:MAG: hypothetical protein IT437_08985 [Phycisphaerales bacterium]|nr:hypothetical protein [Phycisphaerales bacterium]
MPDGAVDPGLTDTVYAQLRAVAQNQMSGERAGHSLSATALVHEAYLRLEGKPGSQRPPRSVYLFAAPVSSWAGSCGARVQRDGRGWWAP